MQRKIRLYQTLDWWIIAIYLIIIIFGWINVYGASYDYSQTNFWSFNYRSGKQLVWIACAIVIAGVILLIDGKIYEQLAYYFYAILLAVLVVTIVIAPNIHGSHSWLVLGPVSFQPIELAKLATALALSRFISKENFSMRTLSDALKTIGFVIIPFALGILQSEAGSALVFLAFFLMLYREGLPGVVLLIGACFVVEFLIVLPFSETPIYGNVGSLGFLLALLLIIMVEIGSVLVYNSDKKTAGHIFLGTVVLFIGGALINIWRPVAYDKIALIAVIGSSLYLLGLFVYKRKKSYFWIAFFALVATGVGFSGDYFFDHLLEHHQQQRIKVALRMEVAPSSAGYNVNQSKIAIGSGGFTGKGFFNGTQTKLKYVPEQDTDFIFCTVGEEYGFIGSAGVLLLFLTLLLRMIYLVENQRDIFLRVYGYSIVCIIAFHILINIGMVLGITPVIGIPLPFFSYGGSSLWSFTVMLFIFLKLHSIQKARFR